jgi:hypothetical protein
MNAFARFLDMAMATEDPTDPQRMTLFDATEDIAAKLKNFRRWWIKKNAEDDKIYPLVMSEADWFEQFIVWCGLDE